MKNMGENLRAIALLFCKISDDSLAEEFFFQQYCGQINHENFSLTQLFNISKDMVATNWNPRKMIE
jgi:hypothetical protein